MEKRIYADFPVVSWMNVTGKRLQVRNIRKIDSSGERLRFLESGLEFGTGLGVKSIGKVSRHRHPIFTRLLLPA